MKSAPAKPNSEKKTTLARLSSFLTASLPAFLTASLPAFLTASLPAFLTASLPAFLTASLPAFLTASLPAFPAAIAPCSAVTASALAVTLSANVVMTPPACAFGKSKDGNIHDQIVKDALYDTFCEPNMEIVMRGCRSQDDETIDGSSEPRRHFKDGKIVQSLAYVDREKRKILNFAQTADTDEKARIRVLYHFGLMAHTLQDFYSRSNYLELKIEKDQRAASDPYSIELADWTEILTQAQQKPPATGLVFRGLDKSLPETPEGAKKIGDTTYFKVAKALAVRETQRQWNLLETMIKNNLGNRGATVASAIKQSAVSPKMVKAVLDDSGSDLVPEI